MNVVLDSNILLVALGKKSQYRLIWDSFLEERFNLVISDEIVYEYEEVIQQHSSVRIAEIVLEVFVEALNIINQKVYYSWNLIVNDPDDNKFFDVAVAANANYLVTNDSHFNIVKQHSFPSVKIISADEFLEILRVLK